jgi:ADP-heptose:LPS heptosyltransferase
VPHAFARRIAADPHDLDLLAPAGAPARDHGLTVIHPSAASAARRWPIERWAAEARVERAAGRHVALTGSAEDLDRALEIADRAGIARTHVVAGRTGLRELAALVATAGRVICGDTGVAHLATALRTPSVLLFGPMSPGSGFAGDLRRYGTRRVDHARRARRARRVGAAWRPSRPSSRRCDRLLAPAGMLKTPALMKPGGR